VTKQHLFNNDSKSNEQAQLSLKKQVCLRETNNLPAPPLKYNRIL